MAFKVQQRSLAQRVVSRCRHIKQQAAWDAWLEALGEQCHCSVAEPLLPCPSGCTRVHSSCACAAVT